MKTHDLTHLIKYTHTPLATRLCTGHYGDKYVLPKYCILSKAIIERNTYDVFSFRHPIDQKNNKILTITYSADETDAYARFIDKISKSAEFCSIDYVLHMKKEPWGNISKKIYKGFDLPQIKGASLRNIRNSCYQLITKINYTDVITTININATKEQALERIKEHLDKLPKKMDRQSSYS